MLAFNLGLRLVSDPPRSKNKFKLRSALKYQTNLLLVRVIMTDGICRKENIEKSYIDNFFFIVRLKNRRALFISIRMCVSVRRRVFVPSLIHSVTSPYPYAHTHTLSRLE